MMRVPPGPSIGMNVRTSLRTTRESPRLSNRVARLDFSMLKRKLGEENGWSTEYQNEVEDLYRRFLALNIVYRDRKICPTAPIDDFWHAHILDTRAYETIVGNCSGSTCITFRTSACVGGPIVRPRGGFRPEPRALHPALRASTPAVARLKRAVARLSAAPDAGYPPCFRHHRLWMIRRLSRQTRFSAEPAWPYPA